MWNSLAISTLVATLVVSPGLYAETLQDAVCDASSRPVRLDFAGTDLDGQQVRLSAFLRGKVAVVNLWATWCPPCKAEIPGLIDLYDRYRARGIAVVGIAVGEPLETVKPFVRAMNVNYPVLLGEADDELQKSLGPVSGLPTTIVLSRDGSTCKRYLGFAPKSTVEALINRLL